ncbi:MAG TPA: hypothetical protein VEQ42_11440 [Pyrinomonadaceae bacterium]|nr:hypothetical protein [Pyrinomonadaceae bacterium]
MFFKRVPARLSHAPVSSVKRHDGAKRFRQAALLLLAFGTSAGLTGCMGPMRSSAPETEQGAREGQSASATAKATPAPAVQIYEDEAKLRGAQALLGGTVENLSGSDLKDLKLELELKRRKDDSTETRTVEVKPAVLAPGEKGRYAVTVSREWGSARVVRLVGANRGENIAYVSARGARRPPERIPETKTAGEPVPRPRPKGEEFLNTPETADKYP